MASALGHASRDDTNTLNLQSRFFRQKSEQVGKYSNWRHRRFARTTRGHFTDGGSAEQQMKQPLRRNAPQSARPALDPATGRGRSSGEFLLDVHQEFRQRHRRLAAVLVEV